METKLFNDVLVGDELTWQEKWKTSKGYICGYVKSGCVISIECNEDNTLTFVVKTPMQLYRLIVHRYMNIDYYYQGDDKKFVVGVNSRELLAFLDAPLKNSESETYDAMLSKLNDEINSSIVQRLKDKNLTNCKNGKWTSVRVNPRYYR